MGANPEIVAKWRDDFELWCKNNGHNTTEKHQGEYLNFNTFKAWKVWVDARQSVVIPVPHKVNVDGNEWINGIAHGIGIIEQAIEAQGYAVSRE